MEPVSTNDLPRAAVHGEGVPEVSWQGAFVTYGGQGSEQSSIIVFEIEPGHRLGWHTDQTEESQYIVSGTGELHREDGVFPVGPGSVFALPTNVRHDLVNTGTETLRVVGFFAAGMFTQHFDDLIPNPGGVFGYAGGFPRRPPRRPAVPRRLAVAPHLDPDDLRARARAAPAADRVRWLAVRLVAEGRPATEVGPLVGFSAEWVRSLVHRYNAGGPGALGDRRRGNRGAAPLLDAAGREALRAALAGPAPGGGLWTGPRVAAWMADRLGRPVAPQRGWEQLRGLGMSVQVPRPRETRADAAAQAAFKKGGSPPRSPRSPRPTPGRR